MFDQRSYLLFPPSNPWMLTGVYGPSYWQGKADFLNQLECLANSFFGPWVCVGDFNCITSQIDKRGGRPFACLSSGGLGYLIDCYGLIDLGFSSHSFTWCNKSSYRANIKERLDRGMANIDWRSLFPHAKIAALKEAIKVVQNSDASPENLAKDSNLQLNLDECFKREEIHWRQNSRIQWLKEGDRNTKLFHLFTVIRGRRNSINLLKNEDGLWISNRRDIGDCFIRLFKELFTSSNPTIPD
ncbi:hypothetical protein L1049_022481 [Liquidambar formosana]|uniref:Endonuclease/exonuclease/phosphatase n=1 Tax=Liquidambar formosana TaxID=63359 RepID=A0AAP0RD09_LIQFO